MNKRSERWTSLVIFAATCMFFLPVRAELPPPSAGTSPSLGSLHWGLEAVEARKAWSISSSRKEVVVAVIDTGADISHSSLHGQIWKNSGETGIVDSPECRNVQLTSNSTLAARCDKSRNGIDDDQNGFIDDVHGWNFVAETGDISDNHGHGTHIAGIIASTESGVAPRAKLMILKYIEPKGVAAKKQNPILATANAIRYAVKMGASIINYSAGGPSPSEIERQAIIEALRAGVLIVAASGNDGRNSDRAGYFPADYGIANVFPVTAIDPNGRILDSSNYGLGVVRIAAPGENIRSSIPDNKNSLMTGTSQATAFVTGAAALLLASDSSLERQPHDIIRRLILSGESNPKLHRKTQHQTNLSVFRALVMRDEARDPLQEKIDRLQEFAQVLREKMSRRPAFQNDSQTMPARTLEIMPRKR